MRVSSPELPSMELSPLLPVRVLSKEFPVALMSPEPVRVRFSTLSAAVKLTDASMRSVPAELDSVTVVDALETT